MKRKKCYQCGEEKAKDLFPYIQEIRDFAHFCFQCVGGEKPKTKVCTNCKKEKILSEFQKLSKDKDYRRSNCKKCTTVYEKKRRETAASKEYQKDYQKRYRNKTEEVEIVSEEVLKKREQMEINKAAAEAEKPKCTGEDVPSMFS